MIFKKILSIIHTTDGKWSSSLSCQINTILRHTNPDDTEEEEEHTMQSDGFGSVFHEMLAYSPAHPPSNLA